MSDDDELHLISHLLNDFTEAADISIIEGRIDLIKEAERCRVEVENSEDQGNCGKCLLTTGEQMNRAIALPRWAGHYGHAGVQEIVPVQLQVGVTATEQAWKQIAQARIDVIKGFLEAGPGLPVDFPDCAVQRVQGVREIGELSV